MFSQADIANSLMSGSSIAGTLSWMTLVVVCLSTMMFYLKDRRRAIAQPLLGAIPLLLISLCLQIIASAATVFEAFRQIATQKSTGPLAIYGFLTDMEQSLQWRVVEIACAMLVLALLPLTRLIKRSATAREAEPSEAQYGSPRSSQWMAPTVVLMIGAAGGLIWFYSDVPHILRMFLIPSMRPELVRRFGDPPLGVLSSYIPRHLVWQIFFSLNLAFIYLCVGLKAMRPAAPERRNSWTAGAAVVIFLLACGGAISASRSRIRSIQEQVAIIEHDRAVREQE